MVGAVRKSKGQQKIGVSVDFSLHPCSNQINDVFDVIIGTSTKTQNDHCCLTFRYIAAQKLLKPLETFSSDVNHAAEDFIFSF